MSAFISYSWDDDAHRQWVRSLAERLRSDGVDVTLDCWHTMPGDQLPEFMERAIRENDFVIIVCTPRYRTRSDTRDGGVGYEGDIMTAEVMTRRNDRKFIPVLRTGTWSQAAPSWLAGKYYIDLSADPYSERQYRDLICTLLRIREEPPPLGKPMASLGETQPAGHPRPKTPSEFEDIRVTRVIVEGVTEPRNDGTRGSALYSIPFALSRRAPAEWAEMFIENWDHPPRFTTMHRPGIARVSDSVVTLDGTTIDEVERYHRDTLQLAVEETNRQYREWRRRRDAQLERENALRDKHRRQVDEVSRRIRFD